MGKSDLLKDSMKGGLDGLLSRRRKAARRNRRCLFPARKNLPSIAIL